MAQQRIYKQPRPGGGRRPDEDFDPQQPVGPTYDPNERLAQIRERASSASDTSGIDDALRQAEQQSFNPADERSYVPQSIARAEKNRRAATGKLAGGRQVERRLADQETKVDLGNSQNMYKRSREGYQQSRKRGLFIGLGAGGGILSIVAGIAFLLPFKLPGIMDTIINHAGERIERVVERRAEKVLMQFVIRGTAASVANGTVIVTGNPIGDLFANMRTAKFEERLLSNYGLKIEPTNDKRVRITHNGRSLGSFQNAAQLEEFLNKDDLNAREIRQFFKLVVKNEIPSWRFFKRAKFVNWLRLKYAIPRFGAREKEADESDQEYRESVREEHIKNNANASIRNMADFTECVASGGDCEDLDKAGGAQDLQDKTSKAVEESAEELAKKVGQQTTETLIKTVINKILTSTAGSMIPYIGQIDLGARLIHFAGQAANNDIIQKKHAEYVKHSSAVLATSYAGYADQTKAGDLPPEVVGDFAEMFNGLEESAAYDVINGGTGVGVKLEAMEKINESVSLPAFTDVLKGLFNTVGWIGRAPFEAWYYTVSQAFDFVGGIIGDALSWIAKFGPAQALLDTFAPYMSYVFEGFFKLLGMFIDPLSTGAKLFSYVHMGFVGAFNDHAKELGMRLLTNEQASEISQQIAAERAEELKNWPISQRLFDLTNHDSLASNLLQGLPTPTSSNPLGSMALASAKVVASAPTTLATTITPRAQAAGYINLYGEKPYGGLESDLSAQLSPATMDTTTTCPENNDNSFNHCSVDRAIVESINCAFVKCKDMDFVAQAQEPPKQTVPTSNTKCPLPAYPNPSCTGVLAGTQLTAVTGDYSTTRDGEVIEKKLITGDILIKHNGIVIKNSEIRGHVKNAGTQNFVIEDSTIGPTSGCLTDAAIGHNNYAASRIHFRNFAEGARVENGGNVTVQDSYFKFCNPNVDNHGDALQGYQAGNKVSFLHNTVDMRSIPLNRNSYPITAAVFWADNSGNELNYSNNLISGGGYTIRIHNGGNHTVSGNRILNNSWLFGPASVSDCSGVNWNDNRLVTIDSSYRITNTLGAVNCVK